MMSSNDELKSILEVEILKAVAPVTGRLVACVLVTENGIYSDHNFETTNIEAFQHAETRALAKALAAEPNLRITKIAMLGGGKITRYKQYIPCYYCFESLYPYAQPSAEVILFPLLKSDRPISVTFEDLHSIYGDYSESIINSDEPDQIKSELKEKTILRDDDINFLVTLRTLGLENNIEFYLTGSSAGRGGPSSVLIKKLHESYSDLDIIAVVKNTSEYSEGLIEQLILEQYKSFKKEDREIPPYQNKEGVVLKKTIYKCGSESSLILDFTFSTQLKGAFLYKIYYEKNWFHRIS